MELLEFLSDNAYIIKWEFTGSRIICDPPPTDTDLDIIVLCAYEPVWELEQMGCIRDGDAKYDTKEGLYGFGFNSYRFGEYNLIITCNKFFYDSFIEATNEAKRLNLLNKEDRVTLFQKIHEKNQKKWEHRVNKVRYARDAYSGEVFSIDSVLDYNQKEQVKAVKAWQQLNEFFGKKKYAK